jgi:hypothetical protein
MFNGNRRYLIVLAIFILVAFCIYFNYAFRAHEDTLVREMAFEKQQDIGMIAGIIDRIAELDREMDRNPIYDDILIFTVRYIEENFHSTFAQVYDDHLNPLTPLHLGVGGGQKHNPLEYPQFIEAVRNNEYGNLVYVYETEQAGKREIHMTFRWMPSDPNHSSRYLVAIGISKYTINEQIDNLAIYGAFALILVASLFILGSSVLIIRLGYIYRKRAGDVWRDKW